MEIFLALTSIFSPIAYFLDKFDLFKYFTRLDIVVKFNEHTVIQSFYMYDIIIINISEGVNYH